MAWLKYSNKMFSACFENGSFFISNKGVPGISLTSNTSILSPRAKDNNKCMKVSDKNKESSYLKYWDVNTLYGLAVLRKLPVDGFKWVENKSQFNKDFIKKYNEHSDEGYISEVDVQYPENEHILHNDLRFTIFN